MSGQGAAVSSLDVATVQAAVEELFPGLWSAVDIGLSVCATLLLADSSNPVAVIYVGPPSTSKTTVTDMFVGHSLCYRSDNFSPASFVSHAANRSREALKNVDLLPRIKHTEFIEEGPGKRAILRFRTEWGWCASSEALSILWK